MLSWKAGDFTSSKIYYGLETDKIQLILLAAMKIY